MNIWLGTSSHGGTHSRLQTYQQTVCAGIYMPTPRLQNTMTSTSSKKQVGCQPILALRCRASELKSSPDSKSFTRRGSSSIPDPDKAELERERRELRQMRAELERRVAELDRRQTRAGGERRGSMTKTDGSGGASPFRAERAFSQQSSADLDRSLMQVTHFN